MQTKAKLIENAFMRVPEEENRIGGILQEDGKLANASKAGDAVVRVIG